MIQKTLFNTKIESGAQFSPDKKYRYILWRIWNSRLEKVMFVGLNPSTADEKIDDPTIRRCINFAKFWGYGGILMLNLFAYRATDPKELKKVDDPIGPENDQYLDKNGIRASKIVLCWGDHGTYLDRNIKVVGLLPYYKIYVFGLTKSNQPLHPLYLKKESEPYPIEKTIDNKLRD